MTAPPASTPKHHAVAQLREQRLARSAKPFVTRGSRAPRCAHCRVKFSHCLCALRQEVSTQAGVCLLMSDIEALKPSNTGWLIADVVPDTFAFAWSRTEVDPGLLRLLADPQWQACVVFPSEYVAAERLMNALSPSPGRRHLFVLLDGTWSEARKMFRKSPYLNTLPVLSLSPTQLSRYGLRRSHVQEHLCTAEVAAACMALANEPQAADTLVAYLDVFTDHYLRARRGVLPELNDAAHLRLQALVQAPAIASNWIRPHQQSHGT